MAQRPEQLTAGLTVRSPAAAQHHMTLGNSSLYLPNGSQRLETLKGVICSHFTNRNYYIIIENVVVAGELKLITFHDVFIHIYADQHRKTWEG